MINIIISVKGLQKISDRLYIRVCKAKFITILYIAKFIITNDRYNKQTNNNDLLEKMAVQRTAYTRINSLAFTVS